MPQLLPPTFHSKALASCEPFISQAEMSIGTLHAACCLVNSSAYTPQLADQLGVVLPEALRHAVRKRQAEYVASRWLVSKLFETVGIHNFQLLNRSDRSPIWPTGIIGSLSHHDHKIFAVIDKRAKWVGNDIERILSDHKAAELRSLIMTLEELALLNASGLSLSQATTLAFSIKETVYKAVYPDVQTLFGFEQVTITAIEPILGLITARLSAVAQPKPNLESEWKIHYWFNDTEVMSWVVLAPL